MCMPVVTCVFGENTYSFKYTAVNLLTTAYYQEYITVMYSSLLYMYS